MIAQAHITIADLNDPIQQGTAPVKPVEGMLWLDTSVSPAVLKRYDGTAWQTVSDVGATENVRLTVQNVIKPQIKLVEDRITSIIGESKQEWQKDSWTATQSLSSLTQKQSGLTAQVQDVESRIIGGTLNWLTNSTGNLKDEFWTNSESEHIKYSNDGHEGSPCLIWELETVPSIQNTTAKRYIQALKKDDSITLSCYYQAHGLVDGNNFIAARVYNKSDMLMCECRIDIPENTPAGQWVYAKQTIKLPADPSETYEHPVIISSGSGVLTFSEVMLQMGSVATQWSPSVDDGQVEAQITNSRIAVLEVTSEGVTSSVQQLQRNNMSNDNIIVDACFVKINDMGTAPLKSLVMYAKDYQNARFAVTGKNMCEYTGGWQSDAITMNGVTVSAVRNDDGDILYYSLTGTATQRTVIPITVERLRFENGITYHLSGVANGSSATRYYLMLSTYEDGSDTPASKNIYTNYSSDGTFIAGNNSFVVSICVEKGVSIIDARFQPQIEQGRSATAYEPYHEYSFVTSPFKMKSIKTSIDETYTDTKEEKYIADYIDFVNGMFVKWQTAIALCKNRLLYR